MKNAKVACRQLGYPDAVRSLHYKILGVLYGYRMSIVMGLKEMFQFVLTRAGEYIIVHKVKMLE